MCDATFTFGQRGSHFFLCPSQREATRLPRTLTALLSSPHLQQIYHVTLGFEDSYLITWRDKNDQDRINTAGLPQELTSFLHARNDQGRPARNIPQIRCVLGPQNSSFFIHDSAAYLWMNIPPGLLSALQSRIRQGSWTDRPRLVALGADDNFLLITEKHSAVWALDRYKPLAEILESPRSQHRDVATVSLHCYRYGCFIAYFTTGVLRFDNVPSHQVSGVQAMLNPLKQDTQRASPQRGDTKRSESSRNEPSRSESLRNNPRRSGSNRTNSAIPASTERRNGISLSFLTDKPTTTPTHSSILSPARPSALSERARVQREWTGNGGKFTAQSKGMKLSVSFSIGGLARMLG